MFALGGAHAAAPAWWAERGVLTTGATANDYAVANIGQLKHVAKQACLEMDLHLPGGAGPQITALIATWSQPAGAGVSRNDYTVVNHGQLKTIAKLFYDRLAQVGCTGYPLAAGQTYPWTTATEDDASFVTANIGQVKFLFSFDLYDNDADGLPDAWERQYLGNLSHGAGGDQDNDGLTNLQEYQSGRNPNYKADGMSMPADVNLVLRTPLDGHYGVNTGNWNIAPVQNP